MRGIRFFYIILVFLISLPTLTSCNLMHPETKEKTYDKYDFDPYSPRRSLIRGNLLGFYIMGNKHIERYTTPGIFGISETELIWNIVSIGDEEYIIIETDLFNDSYDPIGVEDILIALPYTNVEIGRKYSCDIEGAIRIITPGNSFHEVPFDDDDYSPFGSMAIRIVPIKSLTVEYERNDEFSGKTDYQINGCFTAEVDLNLQDGVRTITLDNGVFRLIKYNTAYTYEDWLNSRLMWGQ